MRPVKLMISTALVVGLSLTNPAHAASQAGDGPTAEPSPLPVPGGKGPGMGRSYQQNTPGPGRGSPGYRAGSGKKAPPPVDAAAAAAAARGPQGSGLARQRQAPGLGSPPPGADYPVYGPPPGLGRGHGGQRFRSGPGYPGLRGPGTGYPRHRQYGSPPLYPSRPSGGQN